MKTITVKTVAFDVVAFVNECAAFQRARVDEKR